MNKTILITGATAGIGEATAKKFASNGFRLIITGRRKERLAKLADELKAQFNIEVHWAAFDIRQRAEVKAFVETLPEEWKGIDILVNNAGLAAGLSAIQEGDIDDWEAMIDTNIKGLLYMTRAIAPLMITRGSGHIFNIGSIAGKYVYANGNVYCGTKHAVNALSESMRIDMLQHGIKVTAIHPGAAETEFSLVRFKGDEERAKKVYEGFQPLSGEDVANTIYYCANLPGHYCINDLVITPITQASSHYSVKK
jgi:NADP-dependent 3-hydroxy acid dehydrogenase YdfG